MKKHIIAFGLILLMDILCSFAGFGVGYNNGYESGFKEGQADTLMKNAGKCFLHIKKEINSGASDFSN